MTRSLLATALPRCACIDIGSNTTRLLVARDDGTRLRELVSERAFTRLGSIGCGEVGPRKIAEVAAIVARQARLADELGAHTVRVVATAAVRSALDEGGRFYLSTGGTALSDPAEPEAQWPIDAFSPHELHVDMKIIRGSPTVHVWALQYDQHSRVADARLQLRSGKNVLKFAPAPNAQSLRIAFRFARRGEVELGPMSAFLVSE